MDEFLLEGHEDLEISTQIIIREARHLGLEVEILDRPANFLRLKKGNHIEYIKEASKTRLDSYMTYLMMENKTVSKLVLSESGLRVPKGESFDNRLEADLSYSRFASIKKVIKPVTTNFGIGIYVSPQNESEPEFKKKIRSAFEYAPTIIIEEFLEGPEYRFLVLGDQVAAVCNRVPANVTGDGVHTIAELVDRKNEDPRRGQGHTTPLERIQKSEIETDHLRTQNLSWDSIPEPEKVIYLRTNSNISTGGDSLDFTESVHPEYKKIAIEAAKSVGAAICGVDIISSDIQALPTEGNHGILEVNFNPVLYIHDFPFQGKNRKVGLGVLKLLGF
jgi:glutamate--cysteine ligase